MLLDTLMTQLSKLTEQHHAFINYLVIQNLKATDAYMKAYPNAAYDSARSASATLLAQDNIKSEIETVRADLRAKQIESAVEPQKQSVWSRHKIESLRAALFNEPDCPHAVRAKLLADAEASMPDEDNGDGFVKISWGE
jgi:predicted NAD-dependent protein-ADP-ribosyltransferase YbiA (DUF1768 family)